VKIKLIQIGKTTSSHIQAIEADYSKRINRYTSYETLTIDNSTIRAADEPTIRLKEGALILAKLTPTDYVVLLDERGKTMDSLKYAKEISHYMNTSVRSVVYIIGGAYGFSDEVRSRAQASLRLSDMTFSHQLVRIIFLEQLYRAFTIINNEPYHHA
jgi:23S rRNA (pseudouridine1915-N3)-methyltransferase